MCLPRKNTYSVRHPFFLNWIVCSLSILDSNSLLDTRFANIFSQLVGCLFILSMFPFLSEALYFDVVLLVYFCFCLLCFGCQKIIAKTVVKEPAPLFSSRNFWLLTSSSLLIQYELIFIYSLRQWSSFPRTLLYWRDGLITIEYSGFFCHKLTDHICAGVYFCLLFFSLDLCVCLNTKSHSILMTTAVQ